jgi:hypothetical protein
MPVKGALASIRGLARQAGSEGLNISANSRVRRRAGRSIFAPEADESHEQANEEQDELKTADIDVRVDGNDCAEEHEHHAEEHNLERLQFEFHGASSRQIADL